MNADSFIRSYDEEETIIVELSTQSWQLIAQLLHIYKIAFHSTNLAEDILQQLRQQTNCVYSDPKLHNVYINPLEAKNTSTVLDPVYFIPCE